VDTRADIYSLGVLLYELLTGCRPFDQATLRGASLDEMRRIVREVEPPRPSERVRTLAAGELDAIAARQPSQLRLALSRSHLVASRIGRLAALDSSAMSAIGEIPQYHRRRGRLFRICGW
jgi:serine/threonine protein kinase